MTSTARHTGSRQLLVVALALTGLSMRTAVTSVGAVLDELQSGLNASDSVAGIITTLPVICFAGIGWVTPRLSQRFGAHQLLVASLVAMTVGLVARAFAGSIWLFLVLSVLALSGGATANVVMPTLVKLHFPDRIGQMTAVYTTGLAIGTTAAAGLTVPFGALGDGWRTGLGSWALLSALAVLPWLPTVRRDRPDSAQPRGLAARRLARSPTAWALTIFLTFQSCQAYIAFGWFANFLHDHGITMATAGAMVAVVPAVTIPVSMVAPRVAPRHHRAVIGVLSSCYLIAYAGMVVAPVGGAWVWMVFAGAGSGLFPLALTQIGLRSRAAATTATLSAFVQVIGYIVSGVGPLLFGVLHDATGGWGAPMALLFVAMVLTCAGGWMSSRPRYVDDEVAATPGALAASSA